MEDLVNSIDQDLKPEHAGETYETLLKVLGNIVRDPSNQKFRGLKKDNKIVAEKLSRSSAAISLLLALGFEDDGVTYHCPDHADLGPIAETVEMLECIVATRETEAATTAAPSSRPASTGSPASPSSPASGGPSSKTAAPAKGFARRSDDERRREDQAKDLEAARAAQRAQFADGGGAAAAARAAAATASPAASPAGASTSSPSSGKASDEAKKKPQSAFDFQNRAKKDQEKASAASSLEELRRQQREKFKQFEADPSARQAAAYQQPASVAPGGKVEQGWGDWFGSMFGGGSSSSSGSGNRGSRPSDDRQGPRMKTINDLPKPVQRG